MGSGKLIKAAIQKHGIENFTKEILHVFDNEEDMKAKEKELVVLNENSYNLCNGGQGGFSFINRTRDHHKHNLAIAKKRSYKEPKLIEWHKSERKSRIAKRSHAEGKIKQFYFNNRSDYEEIKKKANSPEAIIKKKLTYAKNNHQQGVKNSQYGTCWVTNGRDNIKIKINQLDKYLQTGYTRGRVTVGRDFK